MAKPWDSNDRNETELARRTRTGEVEETMPVLPAACAAWASLLPDAAEDLLSEAEQTALNSHLSLCAHCREKLADAKRGAAWLGLLKGHAPEPSSALLHSILAKTSGLGEVQNVFSPEASPAGEPAFAYGIVSAQTSALDATPGRLSLFERLGRWLGLGHEFAPSLQPRLTMTAAMAFLSICLTVNLLGLPDRTLHAQTLRPVGLQRTVAEKRATLVRTFEGIRVVYRVESRMNGWLTASAAPHSAPW